MHAHWVSRVFLDLKVLSISFQVKGAVHSASGCRRILSIHGLGTAQAGVSLLVARVPRGLQQAWR